MSDYTQLAEPPHHQLYTTTDGEPTLRYVSSAHPEIWDGLAHRQHTIVRCGLCGHESEDREEQHAWTAHEYHFNSHHIGTKIVWRAEDVVDESLAAVVRQSRYRHLGDDEYVGAYRGDTPPDRLRDILPEGGVFVCVHLPPIEAYPDSPEAGATESLRLVSTEADDE